MNQINLRRFIYKLYQSKKYEINLINRVEKELNLNSKNKYILENILNYLLKMLRIKIKEGNIFEAVNVNKINGMIKICLNELNIEENPQYLINILNFTASLFNSLDKLNTTNKDITATDIDNTNKENMITKVLINLYTKLLFENYNKKITINENILATIMQYFPNKFLSLFKDLKYKTNKLNIEILNSNSYKLHLYFLCFFIKTNKAGKELKQFIKPLYSSYFIIDSHLRIEKQLNVCDLNFYELKGREELINEALHVLFQKAAKNLNLKKISILKKYNQFMQFLDKNSINEIIRNIKYMKKVNENVTIVYEGILSRLLKDKQKVSLQLFNFLETKKQTDSILESKFFYLISFCNQKKRIENFLMENFFLIKKTVSFNFKDTRGFRDSGDLFKEEELLSIFLYSFNKSVSSELNKIFLIEKIFFNNKSAQIYVFELLNHRHSLVSFLNPVSEPTDCGITNPATDIIVVNEFIKHILLYLIYKHEVKNIFQEIEKYLNPKEILKLNPSKNLQICLILENFLQIFVELLKHFRKLHKSMTLEINDSFFNYKELWKYQRTRMLLLFIYKILNKSDILENNILGSLNEKSINSEILCDLQILENKEATDFITHLVANESCFCYKNLKLKNNLDFLMKNFLFSDFKTNKSHFFMEYLKKKKFTTACSVSIKNETKMSKNKLLSLFNKIDQTAFKWEFNQTDLKQSFLFLVKLNRHVLSPYLINLIEKFPNEKYNNLILQLKVERLILLKDFLKDLARMNIKISLFKRTPQSFEIFFDKKIVLFEYKNYKSLSKMNSFITKFELKKVEDFSTENSVINYLKNILTEKDVEKFINVFFQPPEGKLKWPKMFFGERVFLYLFVLCVLKFKHLFVERKGVFNSLLFSCEFLDIEIEDLF